MNTLPADSARRRRSVPWRGAAMMALGYAVSYLPLVYFLDRTVSAAWLAVPLFAVAALTFGADWKGLGDKPWFVRAMTLAIIAVAVTGALLS
ncbi:hypothetical protein OG788_43130 [Streptomyces sp. NBC_00647]|uniref:hypothetical protein n=1 Tax=Streptomyces sp. NBC_00647 TaxID=2975796 RepID=UPI00324EF442